MADTKATLLRGGDFLGRLESDGSVHGVRGRLGSVTLSGEVKDVNGTVIGSVDDTGLLMTASGDLCGTVDESGNVWAGDETLGQVTVAVFGECSQVAGGSTTRGGAALFFLLRDEPALSLASARDGETPHRNTVPQALPPARKSKRLAYSLAHVAVFGGLALGLWWLGASTVNRVQAGMRQGERRRDEEQARAQRAAATVASSTPPPASSPASPEDILKNQYTRMDAAYNRRDADAFYKYHADDWRFVNKDGSSDTMRQAKKYMVMRFSPSHPKRFLFCSIAERVVSMEASGDNVRRAVIEQTVMTESIAKGRNRTEIRQEDTWRKEGDNWRCARSRILSRNATPL